MFPAVCGHKQGAKKTKAQTISGFFINPSGKVVNRIHLAWRYTHPDMAKLTVTEYVAIGIALYGAVLSTINSIIQIIVQRKDRADIIVAL
jgi:hypothetical protein